MIAPIILVTVFTLSVSFFCSMSETALYSISPGKIESLRSAGKRSGRQLAKLRERIEQPLAAILILNTISNTAGASLAGALVGQQYDSTVVGIYSGFLTLAILWFSEIVPKSIGVYYAPIIAPLIAGPWTVIIFALRPLVWASEKFTSLIKPKSDASPHTEEDILSMARLGLRSGAILPEEMAWLGNVLKINDKTCKDMMTPRPVVFFLQKDQRIGDLKEKILTYPFSRIPVAEEHDLDTTCGIVMRRRLLEAVVQGRLDATVGDLMWPTHFVPESMRGHIVLQEFIRKQHHLFMVVDEHGGVEGLITLEDVLETMLGQQIVDEFDRYADLRELARQKGLHRKKELMLDIDE